MTIEDAISDEALAAARLGNLPSAYSIIENALGIGPEADKMYKVSKSTLAIWRAENRQKQEASKFPAGIEERLTAYATWIHWLYVREPCECVAA